jgi:CheY-like chemotaxis protein
MPAALREMESARDEQKNDPPCVLVADDDDVSRRAVAMVLRADGYEVIEAASGGDLLVSIARTYGAGNAYFAFDAIVSDLRMPVCGGLEVLEALRRAHWSTPFILMTAYADKAARAKAQALGAILFEKPIDLDDLRTTLLELAPCESTRDVVSRDLEERRSIRPAAPSHR